MLNINLENTKQSKQITEFLYRLEQSGWSLIAEVKRDFKGKPKWEKNDQIPNLIYSWAISRNPIYEPIWLDFISFWDYVTYETKINDCSHCQIRTTELKLVFRRDKSLKSDKSKKEWMLVLNNFIIKLNDLEGIKKVYNK